MTQQDKIYRLVVKTPGLSASYYAKQLRTKPMNKGGCNRHYLPPTVLRSLHRLVAKGKLARYQQISARYKTVLAHTFYPL